jgi:hypothetical protein
VSGVYLGLAAGPITRVPAHVAVVAFFADDRPLRGAAGQADWRMCGALSRLIQRGRLSGAFGEAALVPATGGMRARWLLALGLGPRHEFVAARAAEIAGACVTRGLDLAAEVVALPLPPPGPDLRGNDARLDLLLDALARAAPMNREVRVRLVAEGALEHSALEDLLRVRSRGPHRAGLTIDLPSRPPRPRNTLPAGSDDVSGAGHPEAGLRVK